MKTVIKSLFLLIACVYVSYLYPLFTYDKAICAGQQERWDEARTRLMSLMIDSPDDPSVLYDMGVASYKLQDYDHARAYFDAAGAAATASEALKEQAHFNAGNTAVKQKKLHDAVKKYEQVLALNRENERATHNLALVKKMLEEQEQEKKEDKKEQNTEKNKPDDQKNNQENNQENNQNDTQGQDQEKDQQNQQKENDGDQPKQNKKQDKKQDRKENDQKKKSEQQQHKNNEQREQEQQEKQESAKQEKQKKQEKKPEQEQETPGKQGPEAGHNEPLDKIDAWLASVLKKREQEDSALNKQMIKASVEKQLAGRDGQNCW